MSADDLEYRFCTDTEDVELNTHVQRGIFSMCRMDKYFAELIRCGKVKNDPPVIQRPAPLLTFSRDAEPSAYWERDSRFLFSVLCATPELRNGVA